VKCGDPVYLVAGLDTYTTRSLMSSAVFSRIKNAVLSPQLDSCLTFVDGTSTTILGSTEITVVHHAVHVVVSFLVVNTVSPILGADILLGTDYMKSRGDTLVLKFNRDRPIITQFVTAAAVTKDLEVVNGGDFTLQRLLTGSWQVEWEWVKEEPRNLFFGVEGYWGKLKTQEQREWFEAEVRRWVDTKFLIPFENNYGSPRCILTWNPVVQLQKRNVRPTFDYSIINPYIKNPSIVAENEVCHESLRKWRRMNVAFLVDVERAYMNVTIHPKLYRYQVVKWNGQKFVMTRMGFGLNIAPRVLKCLIEYILKKANTCSATNPYRDDILIGSEDQNRRDIAEKEVAKIKEILLSHGLPTKPPVDLYDFRKGPTRALGLELYDNQGEVYWRRKGNIVPSFDPNRVKLRDLSGYVGRLCPAHYPVLGALRPRALQILSQIGKEAAAKAWSEPGSPELIKRCVELSEVAKISDPANSPWKIPITRRWVLATDASGQGLGCCVLTRDAWDRHPSANCVVVEDHAWLVKSPETHINVLELDAVIRSFKILVGYANTGDSVKIVIDNRAVVSWLKNLQTGERIDVSGLYEILVRRRLLIAKDLMEPYNIEVEWVPTDVNPADKLTRAVQPSDVAVSAAIVVEPRIIPDKEEFRLRQENCVECQRLIEKLDPHNQISIVDGIAFKKVRTGRTVLLLAVVPEELETSVIERVHLELGHAGWKGTWIALKNRFCFPRGGAAEKIQKFLRDCPICTVKNARPVVGPDAHTTRRHPWYEVFVDTLQMCPLTETGPRYLLVFIDNYTKFCEGFPVNSRNSTETGFYIESVLTRYSGIRVLRIDNGTEFENEVVRNLAVQYDVQLAFGSVKNPQSQGVVERVHGTLLGILRSLMFGLPDSAHWTQFIHRALYVYRSRPHESLAGHSPEEMVSGVPKAVTTGDFNREDYQADLFDRVDDFESQFQSSAIDGPDTFSAGDRVLVRMDDRRRQKLAYPWTPATVVAPAGRGAYIVRDPKGREAIFNQRSLAKARVEIPFLLPRPRRSSTQTVEPEPQTASGSELASEPLPELVPLESPTPATGLSRRSRRAPRRLITEI
jgi:transposase InsO family protein